MACTECALVLCLSMYSSCLHFPFFPANIHVHRHVHVINLCGTGWINEPSQVEVSGFVLVGVCVSSVSHEVAQFPGFSLFSVCLYETDLLGALHGHMFYQITCPLTSLLLH